MKCCNNELKLKSGIQDGKEIFYYICESCGRKGKGISEDEAIKEFNKSIPEQPTITTQLQPIPKDKRQIISWASDNMPALMDQSAQFIDKHATQIMIQKNIRYVSNLSGKAWDKIWSTPEGQESISHALSESFYMAATLPDMGSIVPFGNTAEFIASVECYKFGLEKGRNAPLKDINILLIHQHDNNKDVGIKDGNFYITFNHGIPRGEIVAVCVYATRVDTGNVVGDIYDVERLMEKAATHSPGYRSYLLEKEDFNKMKVEGTLKTDDSGRQYMEKKIEYTKGGQQKSWNKKTYEHDLINPYDGPDRPEMLRKSAGKSFLSPYMKVRNATAMATEWNGEESQDDISRDKAADDVLSKATDQFKDTSPPDIKDAEIIPPKKEQKNKDNELFDEDE